MVGEAGGRPGGRWESPREVTVQNDRVESGNGWQKKRDQFHGSRQRQDEAKGIYGRNKNAGRESPPKRPVVARSGTYIGKESK